MAGLPFSRHPKDSGVLKFDGTLLCSMIAWNGLIFCDGMAIAWVGTVKRFLFLYLRSILCLEWLSKGAVLIAAIIEDFHN